MASGLMLLSPELMDQHDFDYSILDQVAHRPWPMPDGRWIMRQTWHDLLFAHWPVDQQLLASKLPQELDLVRIS